MTEQHDALLRLLHDDDPATLRLVKSQLARRGPAAMPELRAWLATADAVAARHLREVIAEIEAGAADAVFGKLCADFGPDGDLEKAAWLLAATFLPGDDFARQRALLDAWGAEVARRFRKAESDLDRIEMLVEYLGDEVRLHGNVEDYHNVNNSLLPEVIDTRLGIPISLSLIYILVGKRAGIPISGAGLPGHFLIRHGQNFFADGTKSGVEFQVNTTTANDQTDSQLAVNRLTGESVVTWTSNLQDGSGTGIYAKRYNAAGVAQGAEFRVNTTTSGAQSDSAVAMDAHGYIFVTWAGASTSNGLQIYGQQFDKLGVKNEGEIVINSTAAGDQQSPAIAIDFKGNTVIVWSGNGAADSAGVFKARYRTDLDTFEAPATAPRLALASPTSGFASSQPQRLDVPSVSAPNMDRVAPRANAVRTATPAATVVRHEQPATAGAQSADADNQWQALLSAIERLTGV